METRSGNVLENTRSCSRGDSLMLAMAYDGTGRRVSKTRFRKACISDKSADANSSDGVYAADWERELVTHYTGIGTEVRENYRDGSLQDARVVVNMPQGLGRYMPEDASAPVVPSTTLDENGKPTDWSVFNPKFEWYLKNHLGSTMLVYGTQSTSNADVADLGEVKKAYDYRSFGEQIDLIADAGDKVTENFTGKEKDDETELNYFGARYLDPMIGLWISVDAARQYDSPYTYVGNNPILAMDPDGNVGVVGGVANVGFGIAYNYVESVLSGNEFKYSLVDAAIDFASGFAGVGIVEKGAKAAKSFRYAKMIKNTKPITYKKSGAVATKHKWANRADEANKDGVKNSLGVLNDLLNPLNNAIDNEIHSLANEGADFAKDAILGDPGPSNSISTGDDFGSLAPSDNTATRVEF